MHLAARASQRSLAECRALVIGGGAVGLLAALPLRGYGCRQLTVKVRFPGSGGANDFASMCWHTLLMTVHSKSSFVGKLDFLTSPGYLSGAGAREAAGLPPGTGPYKIITDLAVMGFEPSSKAMMVESLNPGVKMDEVLENTGFELIVPDKVGQTSMPTAEELNILREEVDPLGMVIGRH